MAIKRGPRRQRRQADGLKWGEGWIKERARADGSTAYQACWLDDGETERAKTFPSRDAAENWLRDQLRAKRDGRYAPPSDLTVRRLIEDWLARGAARWRPNTVYNYRERAEHQIYPELGSALAASLTTPRLQHWVDGLHRSGLAPTTIRFAVTVLKIALREAAAIGLIPANPAVGLRLPAQRRAPSPTWSLDEASRVIAAVADEPMWNALYRLALASGMRSGELRALRWSDVREADGLVRVRRTISRAADGRTIIGETTKTGRERAVAIPPSTMKALAVWRTAQKARRIGKANVWRDLDLVFDRGDGGILESGTWHERHVAIIAKAGVTPITLHQLRHTNATLELEAGTHPRVVSERLGHVSITTTLDRYSHVSVDLQRAAAEALDDRLFGDHDRASNTTT